MVKDTGDKQKIPQRAPFVFYVILIAIPLLFFVILEIALRLADYGYDYQLFKEKDSGVAGVLYVNPEISYKYFGNLGSSVFNSEIGFYKNKPEDGFRVFVLGGSSTQGFPYNPQASFPAHLKRRLEKYYPDKQIEVVNMGASAINSYTIRDILPDILQQSPDLIIIYAGHNEYYGALGAGSSRSVNPGLANTLLYLRDFRTVQMLENLIAGFSERTSKQDKNLMQRMIGQSLIEYGSTTYFKGIEQFEANFSAIIKEIQAAQIPLVVGTLSSNIGDQLPFNADQVSDEGYSANNYFSQGKELLNAGKTKEAKEKLIKAKEYDGLRFRAPEKINTIILEKSQKYGVPIADIDKAFSESSPATITGNNLMCDHLHPNRAGYFLISKIYYETALANNLLPSQGIKNDSAILDSLLLAEFPYTAFDTILDNHILYSGLGQYPFVAPGAPNPYQEILDQDGVNFNRTSISETDSARIIVANNHLLNGDSTAFTNEMRVFTSYFPYNEGRYLNAINRLSKLGSLAYGYPLLLESLQELNESNAKTKALGIYYKFMQQYDSALHYLKAALEVTPDDNLVLLDLGFVHLGQGEYSKAESVFTQVIQNSPDNQEAFHQRSIARFELKKYAGTIDDITTAMTLKGAPDSLSYLIRGYAHLGNNDRESACADWQASARLGSKQSQMLIQNYCNN